MRRELIASLASAVLIVVLLALGPEMANMITDIFLFLVNLPSFVMYVWVAGWVQKSLARIVICILMWCVLVSVRKARGIGSIDERFRMTLILLHTFALIFGSIADMLHENFLNSLTLMLMTLSLVVTVLAIVPFTRKDDDAQDKEKIDSIT